MGKPPKLRAQGHKPRARLRWFRTCSSLSRMARDSLKEIREAIEAGHEPLSIAELLGMEIEDVEAGMRKIFETMVSRIEAMPREHMYAELLLVAAKHMRDLNALASKETTPASEKVSAIKASWAIRKSLLAEARELGLVAKTPNAVQIDMSRITDMDSSELLFALKEMIKDVRRIESEYGQAGIMSVSAGSLFGESVN